MSKSYWMKEQKGDFSNDGKDTFDPKKKYVGARLQQGVPLLDRDWNELEDIRRYEEAMLRKWYIGNGSPDNGFKISALDPPANDFKIATGKCLVDGFEAVNEPDTADHILYSDQEGVDPLTRPFRSSRIDIVYLDVWIKEVTSADDLALKNPDVNNIETCVRHKLEWRVRVAEGGEGHDAEDYHHYYDIATIQRAANKVAIVSIDNGPRTTGLAVHLLKEVTAGLTNNSVVDDLHRHSKLFASDVSPYPVLSVDNDGNVGIGTDDSNEKLHVNIRVSQSGTLKLNTGNGYVEIGPENEYWSHFKTNRPGFYFNKGICVDGGSSSNNPGKITSYYKNKSLSLCTGGTTRITILKSNGNVGIGTTEPGQDKLDVQGRCYSSGGWHTTNADYAEYLESDNGSVIPVATSASLTKNGKVRNSKKGEIPIGIITTNSALVGNSYKEWPKKYLRDEFGNLIMGEYEEEVMVPKKEKVTRELQKVEKKTITEEVTRTEIVFENGKYIQKEISEPVTREVEEPVFEEVDLYDTSGKNVIGKHRIPVIETYVEEIEVLDENGQPVLVRTGESVTKQRPKLNPEYDESHEYVLREERPEWNCVGLLGQLPLRKGQPVAPTWIKIKDISEKVEMWLVR